MKVKIKKLVPEAIVPKYAKTGDAGLDFTAVSKSIDSNGNIVYGTGLAVEIPTGHVGLLFPRSSISNYSLLMSNSVGVIDSGYRGEIICKMKQSNFKSYVIGDRIAQLIIVPYPAIEFEEVDELSTTERGDGGYGSTGK